MKKTLSIIAMAFAAVMAMPATAQDKTAAEYKNEGNAAVKAKNFEEALKNFEQAIALWGDSAEIATVYNAADCANKLKDYEKAIKYYALSLEKNYKPDFCAYYTAKALKAQGKDNEQLAYLEDAVKKYTEGKAAAFIKKDLVKEYTTKAKAYYDEAAKKLTEAQTAASDKQKALQEEAKVQAKNAVEWIEKGLKVNPADPNCLAIVKAAKDIMTQK